ncbi:indole-3-glycerol phosphate synthase [Salinarchaeum sp. Harcht-Bsk1]|uniref:indole-3-glycerol phosphate synthase n=1 Tax=Salinarchaeum sp. Harcht-Bsk1 TaxID=1333523 RepID=UPI0003423A26|nr:indole-3-glycerol phosphate synthase [Salinarchaeum sp. Harcht-Bsk1]AGM99972.1 indole-3-glycerol phosphate synthase [Salinarchaeum sp. Harcht-Bsk1]
MDTEEPIAPAVRSILDAARDRGAPDRRLTVDPRSLVGAFEEAESDGRMPVIAEVKPTSPTAEGTRTDDPVALAEAMVAGGASALSVLTEPEHFGGSPETLERVREVVDVPVLRKDFLLEEGQLDVVEADVVLLIVRFVDDLSGMLDAARERGFQVLVEVHTPAEFEAAVDAGADVIGINNRDLAALEVDLGTTEDVLDAVDVPDDVTVIAESGIQTAADARRLREAGADALLIGSAIMDHAAAESDGASVTTDSGVDTVRSNTETFTTAETEVES